MRLRANRFGEAARLARWLVVVAVVAAGCGRDVPPGGEPRMAELTSAVPALLVDAAWLSATTAVDDVVLLHVAPDSAAFEADHIPGARFLPLSAVLVDRGAVPNELPPLDEVRAAFEVRGVGDGRHVVVYGEALHAARAFIALDVLGHDRVSLLDGGLAAWRRQAESQGGPRSASAGSASGPTAGTSLTARPRPDLIWSGGNVNEAIGEPGVVLLDARPPQQFAGPQSPGRIPTAQSLFWQETLQPGAVQVLRPRAELEALFAAAGARPDDVVVTYCRTGMQASFLYFVARYLGYETRLYDGSFADWSANARYPVERG